MTKAARSRHFIFRWIIVAVLFLCVGTLMGTSIYGFVMLADIMSQAHGWSEAESGSLVSAMWLVAPIALLSAPVIQRFGPWKLVIAGLLTLAITFASLTLAVEFWQVYGIRILMGFGKVAIMMSAPVIVAQWFEQRFGTAIAIVWAGGSAGGIVFAPLVEFVNRTTGFTQTALVLAAWIGFMAIVAMLAASIRNDSDKIVPEEQTANADGAEATPATSVATSDGRTWQLSLGIIFAAIALGGANVAVIAMNPHLLTDVGFDSSSVALIVGFNAAASAIGALMIGVFIDRFGPALPTLLMTAVYASGMLLYLLLTGSALMPVALSGAVLVGLGAGAAEVLWISLLKREASPQGFAAIYGIWYFAIQVGYAVGGIAGGWALGNLGITIFILSAAAAFAATPLFATWRVLLRRHTLASGLAATN